MVYPCNPGLWVYWAPPAEQSRLVSLTYAGVYSGILLMMFIGGIIADNLSWRGVFIFPGIFISKSYTFLIHSLEVPTCLQI